MSSSPTSGTALSDGAGCPDGTSPSSSPSGWPARAAAFAAASASAFRASRDLQRAYSELGDLIGIRIGWASGLEGMSFATKSFPLAMKMTKKVVSAGGIHLEPLQAWSWKCISMGRAKLSRDVKAKTSPSSSFVLLSKETPGVRVNFISTQPPQSQHAVLCLKSCLVKSLSAAAGHFPRFREGNKCGVGSPWGPASFAFICFAPASRIEMRPVCLK
mmetsp:Transcript_39683/g.84832  ORF Transcript_39683/g.84832 Transcript_39683/m.84832 type:complete len:216 (+) Transcript_39683:445-1092(+)